MVIGLIIQARFWTIFVVRAFVHVQKAQLQAFQKLMKLPGYVDVGLEVGHLLVLVYAKIVQFRGRQMAQVYTNGPIGMQVLLTSKTKGVKPA